MTVFSEPFKAPFSKPFKTPFRQDEPEGFLPTDISNLEAWYDSADAGSITEVLNAVSSINDKSGNGNTLSAAFGEEPTTNINTMNGKNVLLFNGGTDKMSASSFPMTAANTTFIVCNVISAAGSADSTYSFDAPTTDYQLDAAVVGEYRARVNSTNLGIGFSLLSLSDLVGLDIVVTVRWKTSDTLVQLGINGIVIASEFGYNGNMNSPMVLKIASNRLGSTALPMDFAEFVHYNRELLNSEVNEVENYLIDKWGI